MHFAPECDWSALADVASVAHAIMRIIRMAFMLELEVFMLVVAEE